MFHLGQCVVLGRTPTGGVLFYIDIHNSSTDATKAFLIGVRKGARFSSVFSGLPGLDDPLLAELARRRLPATEANYLMLAFPEGPPDQLPAEYRAEMDKAIEQGGFEKWQS